ncbi:MAG: hypothetical protein CTY37_00325 [Methylotenera sp.]|nr:MAG: hypothetical protein CTY37_00325 [Methylotenera sp.]
MIKSKKFLFGFLIFVISILLAGCVERFAKYAAEKVYPDLIAPYDTEAPATATTYPASTSIKAVIGGKGEGLSCSVPWLLEKMMFSKRTDEAPLSLQLRQACVRHDYCYRHGWATYGYQQVGCDFALQQDAYRICRLISPEESFHEDCLSKARRVLLGVRIGGGDPFQEGEKSSYFEYDPMPSTADDYVVLRWMENSASTTNELCVNRPCLRGNFFSLHFNRGSVVAKKMVWDGVHNKSTFKSLPTLFPDTYISTPPHIIFDGNIDRLISIARKGYENTVFELVEYQFSDNKKSIFLPKIEGKPNDASVFSFDQLANQLVLSYWSHRMKHGIYKLKHNTLDEAPSEIRKPPISDTYRTLAHKPLSGDFFEAGKRVTLVLKRGGSAKIDEHNSGQNYKEYLHIAALKSNLKVDDPIPADDIITIKASEADEPLAIIKNDDGRDLLMNMSVSEDDIVQFNIFDLLSCKNRNFQTSESVACEPSITKGLKDNKNINIDKSWVRQPVQLVAPRSSESSPLIFFSKVEKICKGNMICKEDIASRDYTSPEEFRFNFAYSKLDNLNGTYSISKFLAQTECKISLKSEALLNSDGYLIKVINHARPSFDIKTSEDKKTKNYEEDKTYLINLVKKEFFERWANAQVIPGWFFKTDIPIDINKTLDVAVFFRGYTNYSFLLANGLSANDNPQEKKVFYTSEAMSSFFHVNCENY